MALKTYVGARYAPRFMGAWNKANEYAALSVVYHDNQSYVSRKTVPAETEITNTEYWIRSSDWNAQVDEYRNQVNEYDEKVVQYNQNVEAYNTNVNNFFEETIHAYNTKEDMVNDESIKLGYTLITCGETSIGDGGGSFYQAVSETSSGAVALKNGLFAKKFQLMPERFNRWTVDVWGEVKNLTLAKGDIVTNANLHNAETTDIIAPKINEQTYNLEGVIKRCEFLGEYPALNYVPKLGHMDTFLLKSSNNTYLHFRIIEFVPNQTSMHNTTNLYLLPSGLCTNETPNVFNDTSVTIGTLSGGTSYTLHMHGTPNSKVIIPYTQIGESADSTGFLTTDGYPDDFYVTISMPILTRKITATSIAPSREGLADCTVSMAGNNTYISDIKGFLVAANLNATANRVYNFNLGKVGYNTATYIDDNSAIILRQILVPFHAESAVTVKTNIAIEGEAVPESTLNIPSGYSVFMLTATYAKDTHAFTAGFSRLW